MEVHELLLLQCIERVVMGISNLNLTNVVSAAANTAKSSNVELGPEVTRYLEQKAAQKALLKSMSKPVKMLDKMKNLLGGEATNICINALGTGLIAPIFIKYNFLSKTDDDTRTYSAWRQPVSAVLSVATQVGLLIPINRWMNKLSNEGRLLNYNILNQGGLQNEAYLTKRIKAANPGASKKEISEMVKNEQNKQLQALVDSVNNKNTISFKNKNNKRVTLTKEKFNDLVNGLLDENENKYKSELERYETEKAPRQKAAAIYKYSHAEEANEFLTTAQAKANEFGDDTEKMQKWLKSEAKAMKQANKDPELIQLTTNISKRPNMQTIKDKIVNDKEKVKKYSSMGSISEVEADVNAHIENAVNAAKGRIDTVTQIRAKLAKGHTLKNALKGLEDGQPLKDNFVMDVVQKYSKDIQKNMKGFGAISGALISLAILPVSCDLLNRLYPKFMDLCFPSLSKKKAQKPDDANGKAKEVK